MKIRRCTEADLDGYLAIQEEEWGDTMAASRAQLQSRLERVGNGMLVIEHEDEIVAGASFIRLPFYDLDAHWSWNDVTSDGWCTNNDPDGDALFGVDLSVGRRAPRATSATLIAGALELTMRTGAEGLYWGSRLPRYHRHAGDMSAETYARTTNARGRYIDPEIELYSRIPEVEILGVVPDYFKDWESLDYGCILRWPNPIHRYPFLRPFSAPLLDQIYRRDRRRRRRRRSSSPD